MTIGYAVNGRIDYDDFENGVMKAGRMNLDNSINIRDLVNKNLYN